MVLILEGSETDAQSKPCNMGYHQIISIMYIFKGNCDDCEYKVLGVKDYDRIVRVRANQGKTVRGKVYLIYIYR